MKIKHTQFYIGLDVHKRTTTYVVRNWDGKIVAEGTCATTFEDLYTDLEPYLFSCIIGLEASTSYYHIYRGFQKHNIDIRVANVIQLRKLVGKSDLRDARRLADMLRLKTFPESHIPTEEIQHLRNLVKLRQRFVKESTKLRNQIHALLDKDGIKFPVKTPFTQKWCAHLHKYLTETNSVELRYLYESEQENQKRINNISMDLVTAAKKQFPKEIDLLKSIPGVGDIFSSYLVAQNYANKQISEQEKIAQIRWSYPRNRQLSTSNIRNISAKIIKPHYLTLCFS
jgi:transposase